MKVFDKKFNFTSEFEASLVEAISIISIISRKTAKIIFTINYSENDKWILTYDSGKYCFYHNTDNSYCARNKKTIYYAMRNIFKKYYSNDISIVFYVIDSGGNNEDLTDLTDNLNDIFPDNEDIAEYILYPF